MSYRLQHKNRIYTLHEQPWHEVVILRGVYCISTPELGLYSMEPGLSLVVDAYCQLFDAQYRDLVECDVSELTDGARHVRAALQDLVISVEQV